MKDLHFTIVVHTVTICFYAKKCGFQAGNHLKQPKNCIFDIPF